MAKKDVENNRLEKIDFPFHVFIIPSNGKIWYIAPMAYLAWHVSAFCRGMIFSETFHFKLNSSFSVLLRKRRLPNEVPRYESGLILLVDFMSESEQKLIFRIIFYQHEKENNINQNFNARPNYALQRTSYWIFQNHLIRFKITDNGLLLSAEMITEWFDKKAKRTSWHFNFAFLSSFSISSFSSSVCRFDDEWGEGILVLILRLLRFIVWHIPIQLRGAGQLYK